MKLPSGASPASSGASWRPAAFAFGAALGTALLQSDLKILRSLGYTIELLLFIRYAGAFIVSTACVFLRVSTQEGARHGVRARFKPLNLGEQLLRGALMLGTTLGVFFATMYLVVAQLSILSLATWPLLALAFAKPFGEKVFKPLWVAASTVVTLGGLVVLAVSAGMDDAARFAAGAAWVCVASVCTALNQHLNRRANQRGENAYVSMFYQSVLGFVFTSLLWFTPIAFFRKIEFEPGRVALDHVHWLLLVAVLGFLPQLFYLMAARAPVTRTTPIAASQPIIGGVLDYLRDRTVPAPLDWVGLAVLGVGVVLVWPALFARAKGQQEPDGDEPNSTR